ncbi:uncharacterized protein C1orf109 [Aplysia californica]|uniref:Uncharacterized protein C1orf109 n=1 Tax=Aplysia californica TaxID=6500 RepID=A0ABM1VR44_APLCA|nr:uncharacterized protein C1orf109 [Aplysia californica]
MTTVGEEIHSAGITAVSRRLQKYLKKLVAALPRLEKSEKEMVLEVTSLANLLEQRDCVLGSESGRLGLLSEFPDLRSRLVVKLSQEIDGKVLSLGEHCDYLQELHAVALKGREEVAVLCHQYQQHLDPTSLRQGEATTPPLSVMLGWMVEMEVQLREQYASRQQYLASLADGAGPVTSENLPALWGEGFDQLLTLLQDCREQGKFFLAEK